jgi:hypothetical protein
MCANQQPGGVARIAALGVMMLLPFGIAIVVYRTLRRATRATDERAKARAGVDPPGESVAGLRELNP